MNDDDDTKKLSTRQTDRQTVQQIPLVCTDSLYVNVKGD